MKRKRFYRHLENLQKSDRRGYTVFAHTTVYSCLYRNIPPPKTESKNTPLYFSTLLLKLLTPSRYSVLYHGIMQSYDWINFFISSHVFIQPQEWIKSSATITGWFSILRTQNKQPLYATHEYRRCSVYWTISCWKNPLLTELFNIDNSTAEKLILFPTYCS